MDSDQFDALVCRLSVHLTRRRSLGVLGGLGIGTVSLAPASEARKKKKKGKKGKKSRPSTTQPPTTSPGASCADGTRNGDETDVDCGGSCPRCSLGKNCLTRDDCDSAICTGLDGSVLTCQTCTPGTVCAGEEIGPKCGCDQTADGRIVCNMDVEHSYVANCSFCPDWTNCVPLADGAVFGCYPPCIR